MSNNIDETMMFQSNKEEDKKAKDILIEVKNSLEEKGYNPINQLIGYILSGDPSYITSHNNARNTITKVERDELLEEILSEYLKDL